MQQILQEEEKTTKQQTRARYDYIVGIEAHQREKFLASGITEVSHLSGMGKDSKFFVTFPYPYMNGYLHLGHAFSMTKSEFTARYQRQLGKNVLFPFAFHCTGMPMTAAALKLTREIQSGQIKREVQSQSPTQFEILQSLHIPDEEIPKFQNPHYWSSFFPPQGKKDLQDFGIYTDWRRSFITTEANPFYSSFIEWQFQTLKEKGYIKFGKRHTIFSERDGQPCSDHDRAKGEGVGPQKYTLIKIKCLELPASMVEQFEGKEIFLVAATLRPETMGGQTNVFIFPEGEYGVFEMKNGDYFICSPRSARNMAFQGLTKEDQKYECLQKILGKELIGIPLCAPQSHYEIIYCLPMLTISMNKGTGIVTSVPSDAPDDWAALRDFQNKEGLRKKFNVREEWCVPFKPIPIIEIPGLGNMAAITLVEQMDIQSQNDREKLAKAKDQVYLKGFYEGKMIGNFCNGMKVSDAKKHARKFLIQQNLAVSYFEPESEVISRTGDECVVSFCDQWFINYGEECWKNSVKQHLTSANFNAYSEKNLAEFKETLDWLKKWACSRSTGLGTKLPWDRQWVIESLSDSTIYMAYYTIAHLLQGGVLDGQKIGPLGIKVEQMTKEVWEYIFKKGSYPQDCQIPEENLAKLRSEFEYWYPMDLRVSAKDLIRNHLTMSLYNHYAIWQNYDYMPKGFFCNGYILVNGKKMSKSEGNFFTLKDCIMKFGADPTRFALADAGDSLDDANFEESVADSAISKLYMFERFVADTCKAFKEDQVGEPTYQQWDSIFENEIYALETIVKQAYDELKFKQVIKYGFFEMQALKDDYVLAKKDAISKLLLLQFIQTKLIFLNPICPHFAEHCWSKHLYPIIQGLEFFKGSFPRLIDQGWVKSGTVDPTKRQMYEYLKKMRKSANTAFLKALPKLKNYVTYECQVTVALAYPYWYIQVVDILDQVTDIDNFTQIIKQKVVGKDLGRSLKLAGHLQKVVKELGKEKALSIVIPFNEVDLIEQNKSFIFGHLIKVTVQTSPVVSDIQKYGEAFPMKPTFAYFGCSSE